MMMMSHVTRTKTSRLNKTGKKLATSPTCEKCLLSAYTEAKSFTPLIDGLVGIVGRYVLVSRCLKQTGNHMHRPNTRKTSGN